ncbi:MAG: hypothetical protein K2G50_03795, partial [Anaeroplasmataceae bacterium]|nr:hypothetical protein [Anaeroplasmataceae bacterium]
MVKNKNTDSSMVSFVNNIIGKFSSNSIQEMLNVDSSLGTMRDILFTKIVSSMSEESLTYYLVVDNAAYIYTLVDVAYHLILFIVTLLLYLLLIFLFYIIYAIAYPVRRKVKKWNKKFEAGEVKHPYKKKRLLGGLIGTVRSLIIGVIAFSFIGGLLFVLTANEKIPSREELREEEVSFDDENFNKIYDYYSYVCELSDTGIFKVLNGIKDTKKTPFYFYISDLVFQGQLTDENLDINEKLYLREELGEYVGFVKDVFLLMVKYTSNEELNRLIGDSSTDEKMDILISVFQRDGFSEEFDHIIDNFETKPFIKNLCISSLTSLINHIDLAANGNEKVIGLVNTIFKGENALKVTDLGTEEDIKNIFKAVVNVVASSNEGTVATQELLNDEDEMIVLPEPQEPKKLVETKQLILYANKLIPTIQNLSI